MASKAAIIAIGGTLLVGAGIAYWATTTRVTPGQVSGVADRIAKTPVGQAADQALMTEEERRKYVDEHVVVEDLEVSVDTKEGEKGDTVAVPGLLKARGVIVNKGDRPVTPVTIHLLLLGKDDDDVLGAYVEEVTGARRLEPGTSRPFAFTLPDKKGWGGTFKHSLK